MYSISGTPLDNDARDWSVQAATEALSPLSVEVQSLQVPGRDGYEKLPSRRLAPRITFVVRTPKTGLPDLYSLFSQPDPYLSLTADATKRVYFELLTASPQGLTASYELVEVTFVLSLFGVDWRDSAITTSEAMPVGSASANVAVFPGISAPITDALVRVNGDIAGLRVTDSGGSWFSYADPIPAGSYLIFDCATGFSSLVTSDTWSGGADVTGKVDYSGGPVGLSITPHFVSDPSSREGLLTVTSTTRSGASVQVRGRNAYVVV